MINVQETKQKIISFLKEEGPKLPIQISKKLEIEPMFSSAILAELLNEKRIKTSSLRIGASPLYLLPGQENHLEAFADDSLHGQEKEAFLKLKQNKVLQDDQQPPQIRVALRSIKDFAFSFKHNEKIFWRYAFTPTEEIQKRFSQQTKPAERNQDEEPQQKTQPPQEPPQKEPQEPTENTEKKPQQKKSSPQEFLNEIKEFLLTKDIEILKEIEIGKKDLTAIARINSDLGKIKFFLTAKDKKRPNLADLTLAYQRARDEKMPCLFISRGEPATTTKDFQKENENLLKIESLE